jgi:hypothetical protein
MRLGMKAIGLLFAGTLLPLTASPINFYLGGVNCGSAGICTPDPRATTITFDLLGSSTPQPYIDGDATYTWTAPGTPFVDGSSGGQYASPPNDTTPYLAVGSPDRPETVTISFSQPLSYFGFYLGSPDAYNVISFYGGPGLTLLQSFTGAQLINPGNGDQLLGDFVNFDATGTLIGEIVMTSTSPAFETDNHAYDEAPEPATGCMLALGLALALAAAAARRRFQRA